MVETELQRMVVRLVGNSESYTKMLQDAEKTAKKTADEIENYGRKMENIGNSLKAFGGKVSLFVSAPLAGLGALATKEFGDYEAALSRMVGVVGLSDKEVAEFSEVIKNLAKETGKSPLELASALENITSSGIRGKDALEALTQTTKAAAGGLGEIRSVSSAVTAAMNAYGSDVLSATRATDILTQAVLEGSAEASEFAPVMGQVMPYAKELGVTFDQAAGSIAFLTRTTGNASLAATQVKGLLNSILRMKDEGQAAEALAQIGMSGDYLRRVVAEKGLLPALMELRKGADAAGMSMSRFFTDGEALLAALQMSGDAAGIAAGVIDRVGNSAGAADRAFEAFSKTMKHKFNLLMAEGKVALIELGESLQYMVDLTISWTKYGIEAWKGLSKGTQENIIVMGSVLAALGPLIVGLGVFIASIGQIIVALKGLMAVMALVKGAMAANALALGFLVMGVVYVAALAVAFYAVFKAAQWVLEKITGVNAELKKVNAERDKLNDKMTDRTTSSQNNVMAQASGMSGEDKKSFLNEQLEQAKKNAEGYQGQIKGATAEVDRLNTAWNSAVGNKLLEEAQVELAGVEKRAESASEWVKTLEAELASMPEVASQQQQAQSTFVEIDPEVQKKVDELTTSMKLQAETIGMTAREAEIYGLKSQGALTGLLEVLAAEEKVHETAKAAKDLTDQLKLQADTMGMTSTEAEIYKLNLKGLTDEQEAGIVAAGEAVKAAEKQKALIDKSKSLVEQYMTSEEKYKKGQKELEEMYDQGLISMDVYNKSLKDLHEQTNKNYQIDMTPKGVEALTAGSTDALLAMQEYRASMMGSTPDLKEMIGGADMREVTELSASQTSDVANAQSFTEAHSGSRAEMDSYDPVGSVNSMMRSENDNMLSSDGLMNVLTEIKVATQKTADKEEIVLAGADL